VLRALLGLLAVGILSGCQTQQLPPMATVSQVDLGRFMGDWYVIAHIPTFLERGAHNAVESYRLDPDGTVATTFTFREGGFDGESKRYEATGFVMDGESKAVWGMQFVWPIKADYRIVYLSPDYGVTVIARAKRDYLWIMARTPRIEEPVYQALVRRAADWGYDTTKLRRVPQRWEIEQ